MSGPQRSIVTSVLATICMLCLTAPASAQGSAGIAGTVNDATGAVLPGVTVEASGPALIEKTRTVVSDGAGQYKIVSLPPGLYTITFTLPGFNSVRREGIELTTGFTATVNGEMRVGAVEETVIVTGQTPVVDIQNSSKPIVVTRDVVDALPTGKNYFELATLIPGVQLMYGANAGTGMGGSVGTDTSTKLSSHGGRVGDMIIELNGMSVNAFNADSARSYIQFQDGTVQEYAFEVSGNSAERESGGVRINLIPKEGGNRFNGAFFTSFSHQRLQSNNLTDELRNQGLRDADRTKSLWTVNPSIGGPILKDRVWFYGGVSRSVNLQYKNGTYYNTDVAAWRPNYDFTRQAYGGEQTTDANVRVTWQARPKHKLAFTYDANRLCQCPYRVGTIGGTTMNTPEAGRNNQRPSDFFQSNWTAPLTNRLLVEVAAARTIQRTEVEDFVPAVAPRITEGNTGVSFRAWAGANSGFTEDMNNTFIKSSVSYVTGSHAAKLGVMFENVQTNQVFTNFMNMAFSTLDYRPIQVIYYSSPYPNVSHMRQLGLFAQDQWTVQRLTMNLGLRYDDYTQDYPDIHLPATEFVPIARDFPGATLVHWRDLSPRLGAAYDLFGTGKTAIKVNLSRYVQRSDLILNPARQNTSVTRPWLDPNGDFIVQGDPLNPAANGELGASNNLAFGQPRVAQNYDPDFARGFGVRPFNWETSVSMQHELAPRIAVNAAYYRRWYGNFQVTDNLLVGPRDFSSYCVTAPRDVRLPNGGGYDVCGLFDVNPDKRGQTDNLIASSAKYGDQLEHWNGIDLTIDARLPRGNLQGGVSSGKTTRDSCAIRDALPETGVTNPYCRVETPFLTQIKLGGSYTLPFDVQVSGTFQSFRSNDITASASFANVQIVPSLGRVLTTGTTATVQIVEPDTIYNPRLAQLDLRFAKIFRLGGTRIRGMVDLYNALNNNTVLDVNNTYGATGAAWLVPTQISLARFVKIGAQIDF
jgi:hypothetical protein